MARTATSAAAAAAASLSLPPVSLVVAECFRVLTIYVNIPIAWKGHVTRVFECLRVAWSLITKSVATSCSEQPDFGSIGPLKATR